MKFFNDKKPAVAVVAATAFLLSAACSNGGEGAASDGGEGATPDGGATNADSAANQETVSLTLAGPVTSLDPATAVSFQDLHVANALYDSLVTTDPEGTVIPLLAESWEVTPTSAVFQLRSGVTCSDGTELTPDIVAASLQRYMDPETNAPLRNRVIGSNNSAEVSGDSSNNTVTVELANPWSELLIGLTSTSTGIVCPAGLEDEDALATESQGTGPYVTESQVTGASYTFASRPDYEWGPDFEDQPSGEVPATLIFRVVEDDNTSANLQESGELEIASYSTPAWSRFEDDPQFTVVTQDQSDTSLLFNESSGRPTADPAVRMAIAQALDRQLLTETLGRGAGSQISNLGGPNYECYDSDLESALPDYDPEAAREILEGLEIQVIGTTLVASGDGTSSVLAQLNQAGADATLQNMNNEAWVDELFSGRNEWDVTILVYANQFYSIPSHAGFMVGEAPPEGQNIGSVDNQEAAELYERSGELLGDEKCEVVSELQRSLFESMDVLPIAQVPNWNVFQDGVQSVVVKGFPNPASIRVTSG